MKNDAKRVPVSRSDPAYPVPEIHAIYTTGALNRTSVDREYNTVSLPKRHNDRPRLHAGTLLSHHEFAACEICSGFG